MMKKLYILLISCLLASCSVYKASKNDGVSVSDIKGCSTRGALLSHGMQCIETKEHDGKLFELYRAIARKSGANYGRAIGHGVLDVCTLGLWEVVGTPMEGAMDNNRGYVVAKVIRPNAVSENLDEIIVYDANGKCVFHKKFD